jgi:hypothetical protein
VFSRRALRERMLAEQKMDGAPGSEGGELVRPRSVSGHQAASLASCERLERRPRP